MRSEEFMNKDVFALDEKIGQVKELEVDPDEWKITHLEIELKKEVAESVLNITKTNKGKIAITVNSGTVGESEILAVKVSPLAIVIVN